MFFNISKVTFDITLPKKYMTRYLQTIYFGRGFRIILPQTTRNVLLQDRSNI